MRCSRRGAGLDRPSLSSPFEVSPTASLSGLPGPFGPAARKEADEAGLRARAEENAFRAYEISCETMRSARWHAPVASVERLAPLMREASASSADVAAEIARLHPDAPHTRLALRIMCDAYAHHVRSHGIMNDLRARAGRASLPRPDGSRPDRAAFDRLIASREPAVVALPSRVEVRLGASAVQASATSTEPPVEGVLGPRDGEERISRRRRLA